MPGMGTSREGYLAELFTSIQGEGLWVGRLHHFVRFAGCSVGCRYCDTEQALAPPARYSVHGESERENPVDPETLEDIVTGMDQRMPGAQALSVTGGEPLEQAAFLEMLLPRLKRGLFKERPVMLETAGLHDEGMRRVREWVDLVAMDLKLPSTSGVSKAMERHARFFEALGTTRFFAKIVVDSKTSEREVAEAAALVAAADGTAPLFIQPRSGPQGPEGGPFLLGLWRAARAHIQDVRVLPQIHRSLGLP